MLRADDYQHLSKSIFYHEESKKLPAEALRFLYDQRLFKFYVPETSGGLELSLPDSLTLLAEVAKIDGNLGWLLSTGSGASYFYGFMEPSVAEEVFAQEKAVIAGSGHPSGEAKLVNGGFQISGSWKYCSGADIATTFTFNCKIAGSDQIKAFILQPDQVKIKHDWDAFGLKSTYTHTVEVAEVFIPDHRTFDITQTPYHRHPIYKVPFLPFAQASIASVGYGIADRILDVSKKIATANKEFWQSEDLNRYGYLLKKVNVLSENLQQDYLSLSQQIIKGWQQVKADEIGDDWPAAIDILSKKLSRSALKAGSELIPYLGMDAIKEHNYINYLWRNLQTASQHILITPFHQETYEVSFL